MIFKVHSNSNHCVILGFLYILLTWGTSSKHLPSCFFETLAENLLEKKAELKMLSKSLCWAPRGDCQGLRIMGTQQTVIAVGDTVCPTDLTQI